MKNILTLLVLGGIASLNTAETLLNSVEDYYWRDYLGLIPADAIVGGKNEAGETTFIGQMNIRVPDNVQDKRRTIDFIPAIITPRNKTAVVAYQGKATKSNNSSNVKILCTRNVGHYSWHNESIAAQPGCHYIVAGQEKFIPLYVGKGAHKDQIIIGKIFSNREKVLYAPYKTTEVALTNYQTLMYCV